MQQTPFHAYYTARILESYAGNSELIPAFASSNIDIYPYQIAAAQFALRSSYLPGAILCDEASLGKTYEALLIATQQWYEGKDRQLLILPTNLVKQWVTKIENSFSLPFVTIDSAEAWNTIEADNPFEQDALVVTTYDFAVEKAEYIKRQKWDLVIFDEADCLKNSYTGENKTSNTLKEATAGAFKLLLTPTPITKDIRDIYGLIYFIDKTILPEVDEFYSRYHAKPENYPELAAWVSTYCFRTLKSQVTGYAHFTNRIPYTVDYELTVKEQTLYEMIEAYLALPKKYAYPKMEFWRLQINIFYHNVSSSPQAFVKTLDNPIGRLKAEQRNTEADAELQMLIEMQEFAKTIETSGKSKILLSVLKKCFAKLRQQKISQKAVIFINRRETLDFLSALLKEKGYTFLTYSGNNSRDYTVMEQFRNDKNIQLLLATDEAAKGLDIEFCPVVVNYDLLFNALEMEQRVSRCHRQGQSSDVVVINLLGKKNKSDVRIMELVNKRILQFDGIFGMSDAIFGNFDADADEVFETIRPLNEIQTTFDKTLAEHEDENKQLVSHAEDVLFTTFTKDIADKVTVTPQYIKDRAAEINAGLWQIVNWFFNLYNKRHSDCIFDIDEDKQTITAANYEKLPQLFYYWSGSQNKPYTSLKGYGMAHDFKPHHGRITLSSVIGRGVIEQTECADNGTLTVAADIEPCMIALYCIDIQTKQRQTIREFTVMAGKTESGKILNDEECREIMELPVAEYTEDERRAARWLKESTGRIAPHELDRLISTEEWIQKSVENQNPVISTEIERMKITAANAKMGLQRVVDEIKSQVAALERDAGDTADRVKQMQAKKRLRVLQRELMVKEESLFLDGIKIDVALEKKIEEFTKSEIPTAKIARQFVLQVTGI